MPTLRRRTPALLAATLLASSLSLPTHAADRALGWVEEGLIMPDGVAVKFKLDTGALTSSMHAEGIERFEKDGKDWVRFKVNVKDNRTDKNVKLQFERVVERMVKVRGAGGAERRPVVQMSVCLGDTLYTEPFTLSDRDAMNYPVLIGRRTLEKAGAVDSGKTFTVKPTCKKG